MTRVREATRSEDVAQRLRPYIDTRQSRGGGSPDPDARLASPMLDDVQERAVTLLAVMPPRQHRVTIEELVCPNDPERGRQAVDALVERGFVAEDERSCLRLLR